MFGKNPVAGKREGDFSVHSIWFTLQGEGPWAGKPAVFVRLSDCNLRCHFCDTDFTSKREVMPAYELWLRIRAACAAAKCNHVVITGGEPMLQPLPMLLTLCQDSMLRFQVETAGTVWPEGMGHFCTRNPDGQVGKALLVVSPKTGKVTPEVNHQAGAWKYLVTKDDLRSLQERKGDGLPNMSTQVLGHPLLIARPGNDAPVYVQPLDEGRDTMAKGIATQDNYSAAAAIAMAKGYRLSLQMHKIVGVD